LFIYLCTNKLNLFNAGGGVVSKIGSSLKPNHHNQWETFYLLIADFSATQNIGGAKELVVLL
jgi:hypothetical protein